MTVVHESLLEEDNADEGDALMAGTDKVNAPPVSVTYISSHLVSSAERRHFELNRIVNFVPLHAWPISTSCSVLCKVPKKEIQPKNEILPNVAAL